MPFKWHNSNTAVLQKLPRAASKTPQMMGAAQYQEGQVEMTEAKRRTPVDTRPNAPHPGQLRDSGEVHEPEQKGNTVSVTLSFDTDYAIYVHENPDAEHPVGQWKFLQSVLEESAPYMAERYARRMDIRTLVE